MILKELYRFENAELSTTPGGFMYTLYQTEFKSSDIL